MDCKNAYLKNNIPYILCKLEREPIRQNPAEIAHAVCVHQAHCPKENCHKLTAGWLKCTKLAVKQAEKPQEAAQQAFGDSAEKVTPKKRTRKKASESENKE